MNLQKLNSLEFSDEELVLQLKKGSETAFRLIFEKYWQELLQFATSKTGSIDIAKEIVQEIFISIWERNKELNISKLKPYLFTAAKYKIIKYLKQNLQTVSIDEVNSQFEHLETDYFTINEINNLVAEVIEELPEKTRTIYHKSREESCTNKQISIDLNISEKTVEYHIKKALMALKLGLGEYISLFLLVKLFFL